MALARLLENKDKPKRIYLNSLCTACHEINASTLASNVASRLKVVIQLLITNSDDIEDSFILERLKKYFNEAGIIDESGINHLAFGRTSYLLNHPNYQKIIINHFKLLIEFVRKLISKKKLNESIDPLSINQELNLQLGSTKINELVSYLMREFPKIFSNKLK